MQIYSREEEIHRRFIIGTQYFFIYVKIASAKNKLVPISTSTRNENMLRALGHLARHCPLTCNCSTLLIVPFIFQSSFQRSVQGLSLSPKGYFCQINANVILNCVGLHQFRSNVIVTNITNHPLQLGKVSHAIQ